MNAEYDNFAEFYDLEYGHKDNDLDFYLDIAQEFGTPVLEIGTGTGRVALELAYEGYAVTGIDNSANMLEEAELNITTLPEENQHLAKFICADMRNYELGKQFPVCIIPFRAFLHNLTQQDQLATLQRIHQHLQPGGILAFDLFVPLYQLFAQSEWVDHVDSEELADENDVSIDIHVQHEPVEQLLTITNTYFEDSKQIHSATMHYRYIFRYEMEALLAAAGFETLNVYGGFDKEPYDFNSGIMVFIAKKQG